MDRTIHGTRPSSAGDSTNDSRVSQTMCASFTAPSEVIDAVQDAVREGRRVVARGGGHCLEGFVDDPDVRVIIDTSLMTGVRHDPDMRAFVIDSGTTLGEVYRRLFLDWGVTLPAGESPYLGLGAHVSGGAFGFLCRQHGLAADHLYAIEVVVVDADGTARSVVATREPSDPNRDLWWAHTGAGGGNFGIVTRCWFRSPGVTGNDPALLLPKAPESILVFRLAWSWDDMDATSFTRLATNFGDWCEGNSDATLAVRPAVQHALPLAPPTRQTRTEGALYCRSRGRSPRR